MESRDAQAAASVGDSDDERLVRRQRATVDDTHARARCIDNDSPSPPSLSPVVAYGYKPDLVDALPQRVPLSIDWPPGDRLLVIPDMPAPRYLLPSDAVAARLAVPEAPRAEKVVVVVLNGVPFGRHALAAQHTDQSSPTVVQR
jgi:hypothetical protein